MPSNTNTFKKYLNPVFIETGSYMGDGIQQAIDAGFKKIISIELSPYYYEFCKNRFSQNSNVLILQGESFEELEKILPFIDEEITFWLDGHHSCGNTALGKYWAPLIQELDIIQKHKIKNHKIMIDDMRCWKVFEEKHGFCTEDIIKKLKLINENYKIDYENGAEINDILIAHIL
jgi:hypothetical protein